MEDGAEARQAHPGVQDCVANDVNERLVSHMAKDAERLASKDEGHAHTYEDTGPDEATAACRARQCVNIRFMRWCHRFLMLWSVEH